MHRISFINALIAVSILALVQAELKVIQVQVLFRHGERTPLEGEIYPNDIHNISAYDPWGPGQLTNAGKMREYKIGELLKTRYQDLLGPVYDANSIWAVSTDTERTKMSLQLVLAGLFPPSEELTWNPDLKWLPIPIRYVPAPLDNLMKMQFCPQYQTAVARVRLLPEVQAKLAVHTDIFNFLTLKTGRTFTGPEKAYELYNLLVAQKALNLSMPEWCTDAVFNQMAEFTALEYDISSYTTELKRLLGGPLVKKFIENMSLNEERENLRKMYLYSAHETTLASFLQAQGIKDLKLPLYGAAVMFEKLRDSEGKVFVTIQLWTGVTEQLITLRLPGCEILCPIETYLQLTREVLPSIEELNCHWKRHSAAEIRSIFEGEHVNDR